VSAACPSGLNLRIEERELEAGELNQSRYVNQDMPELSWPEDPPERAFRFISIGSVQATHGTPCPTQVPPPPSLFVPSGQVVLL
jgi:hypothetical protein